MNDNDTLDLVRESLATARDSLAGVHMDTPLDAIARNARARRTRHRLTGVTGAMAVMAGAAFAVTTLAPSGQPSGPSGQPSSPSGPSGRAAAHTPVAQLAAWTVARQANGDIKVTVRQLNDPSGLQRTLRADGVPANVTVLGHPDPSCRPYPMSQALFMSVYRGDKTTASGDVVLIIDPSALPGDAGVQIGAATGQHVGDRALRPAHANQVHHAVHQPAQQAGTDNTVIRPVLVYASPQCTGA